MRVPVGENGGAAASTCQPLRPRVAAFAVVTLSAHLVQTVGQVHEVVFQHWSRSSDARIRARVPWSSLIRILAPSTSMSSHWNPWLARYECSDGAGRQGPSAR